MISDHRKIEEVLGRGVEKVIKREHLRKNLLRGKKLRVKHGIDPTGSMIHLGRAVCLWKLKEFQELGHEIVLIIGDFTAQIGDASDKTSMRRPLDQKEVEENMRDYQKQIGRILDIKKTEIRYNSEWLSTLNLKNLISLSMKFTAQQMIQRRNFKERWQGGKPIGVHELLYPILQGYDSVATKADVEIGGFDQLFNLKVGREIQSIFGQEPQDIMTLKMLSGLDGRKMSTTLGNVINIQDPPQEMYGKLMSMRDELMIDYFLLCTRFSLKELKKIKRNLKAKKINPRDLKARLAREIVALYHGQRAAKKAEEEFERIFKEKTFPSRMPVFMATKDFYLPLQFLVELNLAKSKSQAKRLIQQGGVKIYRRPQIKQPTILKDWQKEIKIEDEMIIQAGKRRFFRVKKSSIR